MRGEIAGTSSNAVSPSYYYTAGLSLTSPATNLEICMAQAVLVPNVLVRGQVLQYVQETTRHWEAEEVQWRELRERGPAGGRDV